MSIKSLFFSSSDQAQHFLQSYQIGQWIAIEMITIK